MKITSCSVLLMGIGLLIASGCASVKPWEREYLADEVMQFGTDELEASWEIHVQEVLEGSRGGFSGAGGGCGCK